MQLALLHAQTTDDFVVVYGCRNGCMRRCTSFHLPPTRAIQVRRRNAAPQSLDLSVDEHEGGLLRMPLRGNAAQRSWLYPTPSRPTTSSLSVATDACVNALQFVPHPHGRDKSSGECCSLKLIVAEHEGGLGRENVARALGDEGSTGRRRDALDLYSDVASGVSLANHPRAFRGCRCSRYSRPRVDTVDRDGGPVLAKEARHARPSGTIPAGRINTGTRTTSRMSCIRKAHRQTLPVVQRRAFATRKAHQSRVTHLRFRLDAALPSFGACDTARRILICSSLRPVAPEFTLAVRRRWIRGFRAFCGGGSDFWLLAASAARLSSLVHHGGCALPPRSAIFAVVVLRAHIVDSQRARMYKIPSTRQNTRRLWRCSQDARDRLGAHRTRSWRNPELHLVVSLALTSTLFIPKPACPSGFKLFPSRIISQPLELSHHSFIQSRRSASQGRPRSSAAEQNNQSSLQPEMHFTALVSLVVAGFALRVAAQFQLVDPFAEMQRPQAANTASGTPVYTNILIQDYQNGNADLAYRATYDLAPIQSLENKPDEKAQQWNFTTTGNQGEYTIQNVASGTYMSYTLGGIPDANLNLAACQVCGNNAQLVWTFYRPVGDESTTFLMSPDPYDPLNPPKVAVRSWPSGGSTIVGDTNPLTLEHIDGKDEQQRFSLDPGPSTAPQP
uniref:Ricin B lectin domain-containing protein n=1 Tax=Mycena chlorophos TaxID=658473 RepID=A0ABQ0LIX9_MYCCL|nr:predicted protein [Mycena chlorophos]